MPGYAPVRPVSDLERGRFVQAAGIRTHLHETGSGPPVLLLHGSGPGVSAWANWRLVLPELATHFHVIAPDQLGFGTTARPMDGRYGRRAWTAHAISVIEALELDRVCVVGNSMGGAIALSLASARPDLVDRIVLMGTTGVAFDLPRGLDQVWGYTPGRAQMRDLIELFAFDHSIVTDELVELRYQQSADAAARASYEAMFPAPRQRWLDDLALPEDTLRAIEQPTLLVHGREDRVIPFAASLRAFDVLPNAELHAFGNCGHWVQIEQTNRFIDVVVRFLNADSA